MWFNFSTGTLLTSIAITLGVVLLVLGIGWAVAWLLSFRD
jgi:hypothetical protein